jgi:hypothetical protein
VKGLLHAASEVDLCRALVTSNIHIYSTDQVSKAGRRGRTVRKRTVHASGLDAVIAYCQPLYSQHVACGYR